MIFYILFLAIMGILLYVYSQNTPISKVAKTYSSIFLILVVICRYDVGYDYHTYCSFVEDKNEELIEYLFSPFSAYLTYIAIYFDSPQLIFALFGIPTFVLMLSGFRKNSKNYSLSVFILICLFFINFLSVIRQALAVALCFYAYRYIVEKKVIKYFVWVIVAAFFHSSAIILLPLYWLGKIKFKLLLIIALAALILKSVLVNLLLEFELYSSYLSEDGVVPQGGNLILYFYILLFLFCCLIGRKIKQEEVQNLQKIILVGITLALMFGPHLGDRVALYFYIYYTLLIPAILSNLDGENENNYVVLFYFLFVSYFFLLLSFPFIKGVDSAYIPYQLFFLR